MFTRSPSSIRSARTARWIARLFLIAGLLLAYGSSLHVPFVYDDTLAIPQNPTIRRLWPLSDVLWPQVEGGLTVSGRPILNLSFALNYAISGKDPWSYHVFNLLFHAGSALLLFAIARRTMETWRKFSAIRHTHDGAAARPPPGGNDVHIAFGVAALWALHPLATQAVTYTVQRAESLMGFFYWLTLYGLIREAEANSAPGMRRRLWLALSVASCALGMATKEVMATAPLLVLLYDRTFLAGSVQAAWRARRVYYLGLAATWVLLGALVISTGGNRGGTVGIGIGLPLWAYPMTQFEAVTRYLLLAAWPHPLVFEYGTFWLQRATDVLPHALIVLPLLAITAVALQRWPVLGFCGSWFFVILAPTSLAPGTIQMIVEHRMYLPLAAVVAVAVLTAHRWLGRSAPAVVTAAAIALGVLTYQRNNDYQSATVIWADTVAKRPQNPTARGGLAEALTELGRLDEALLQRRAAVRLRPDEWKHHYELALLLAASSQRNEAIEHYERALELAPAEARIHNNLAIVLGESGNNSAALAHYAEALRLNPTEALYHYNRGVALLRAGRPADAVSSFETALRLQPEYPDAHFNLANAEVRLGRLEQAVAHYAEALRLRPDNADYRATFGGALLLAKRPREALGEFQRSLTIRPDSVAAMFGAAKAFAALQRHGEAVVQFESVLRRAPDHVGAHFQLGNVLLDLDRVADAITHYGAALQQAPNDPEAHHNLGVAYARLERWPEARREFETALQLKPDYADARRNLDQLKAVLGR